MQDLNKKLLNDFQRNFPLDARPYQVIADRLGVTEDDVIEAYKNLKAQKTVSRIGAIVKPNSVGASTLAAMAVPEEELEDVACVVSDYVEVNHNYRREHRLNLWFVIAADSRDEVLAVLADIEDKTGYAVLDLPLEQDFHLDLGFRLWT